jgi:hypothetical protein
MEVEHILVPEAVLAADTEAEEDTTTVAAEAQAEEEDTVAVPADNLMVVPVAAADRTMAAQTRPIQPVPAAATVCW